MLRGPRSNDEDDQLCVKVQMQRINVPEDVAFLIRKECVSELKKYTY